MLRVLVTLVVITGTGFVTAGARAADDELSVPAVVEKAEPCVYRVRVRAVLTREVPGDKGRKVVRREFDSTGTGFAVAYFEPNALLGKKPAGIGNTLGYVATNSHVVIEDGYAYAADSPPTIRLRNEKYGVELVGELVGHDPLSDLAVIRVTDRPLANLAARLAQPDLFDKLGRLQSLRFADPARVKAGQDVVAVGFAHGMSGPPTVSKGVVSALGRTHAGGDFAGLLQTDAGINKGNSGGPLLNTRGEVVGVNTYARPALVELRLDLDRLREFVRDEKAPDRIMIRGNTLVVKEGSELVIGGPVEVSQGVNFARSCETARPIVARLIRSGKVERPDLGVVPLHKFVGENEVSGLSLRPGVIVDGVRPGSPAAKAGLVAGDVVTEIESIPVRSVGEWNDVLATLPAKPGYAVKYVRPSLVTVVALVKGKSTLTAEERKRAASEQQFKSATIRVAK